MQILAPNALSSIPPTHTGIPAFSAILFISKEFVNPPTLPGFIFIYSQASISTAWIALSTPLIDSSKQMGVSIALDNLAWSIRSSELRGCSIKASWYLSIDLKTMKMVGKIFLK